MTNIRLQVDRLKQQALAHAELVALCARLAQFERNVREAEDLTGQPFKRGRTIIQRTRVLIERQRAALEGAQP
jgi:hypothetical protein